MKRIRMMLSAPAAGMLLALLFFSFPSSAATKPISSVSVRITSKIEAGDSLPEILLQDSAPSEGEIAVRAGSTRYHAIEAEWSGGGSDGNLESGEEPQMKVLLEPEDVTEYYFLASYRKSDVSVSGGTFVSARREGDNLLVTLRLNPVKGDFYPPEDAWWNEDHLGEARWDASENDSGYYQVRLKRNGKTVHTLNRTSSRSYNFYPYMTEAGDYTFEVRSIAGTDQQKKYGGPSEYIESGELVITDRYVSDGKGRDSQEIQGTSRAVGWFQEEKQWKYRYPDGTLCRDGWAKIDGKWYLFDGNANMLTGWRQAGGQWYYLYSSGEMAAGWAKIDGKWYYLRTEREGEYPEGSMVSPGWHVIGPFYYFFKGDGSMYTGWLFDQGKWYYLNEIANSLEGVMFTGFFQRDGKTYYGDSNGAMAEGWWQIDGNWRYFYPGSCHMAADTTIEGLYIGPDGIWRK